MNDNLFWKNNTKNNQSHHICLPSPSMRALIVGESGCGKTTLLMNLLLQKDWLDYDKLMVCGKSLHQPEYQLLIAGIRKGYTKNEIRQLLENGAGDSTSFINKLSVKGKQCDLNIDVYDGSDPVPDPRDLDSCCKNVCVFDDMVMDSNQNLAENYYTRGRHNNVSCIYISQSYHLLPRQTIRSNANCLILFKLLNKDLKHIHDDIVSSDMDYREFHQFCNKTWQQKYGYVIINKTRAADEGKYISNMNQYYIPQKNITGEGLLNSALKKLPMPEMHLSLPANVTSEHTADGSFNKTGKYSFCGPFTKLDKRLAEGYKGVNSLDEACLRHDLAYSKYKNTKQRNNADDILANEASAIAVDENKPEYERRDARLVTGIMSTKSRFGLGIDSKLNKIYYDPKTGYTGVNDLTRKSKLPKTVVEAWLKGQDTYTLHKPIKHRFKTRRVLVSAIDDQWQADLVDMQKFKSKNSNMKYILTVIDIFSKYAWAIPIKNKTGIEIVAAFRKIFKERIPRKLHTDKGLEFINKQTKELLIKNEVHWFATENEAKAQVVERFNRTLKNRTWKYFTKQENNLWIDVLPDLMYNYNASFHRSIGMTPQEASLKKNEAAVYKKLFPPEQIQAQTPKFRFQDHVRITIKRKEFRKGYRPNFTKEIFIIDKVLRTTPITYKIKALDGEEIIGSFYEQEMVAVDPNALKRELER